MKNKKPQTFIEKYNAIQNIGTSVEAPYGVFCLFKDLKTLDIMGNQISFGEDYVSIPEAQEALNWLVIQLGGTVKW